jgi:1-acyl-sn-glycerol-3-phosphate acyltransferase
VLLICDPIQRLIIGPVVWLVPRWRIPVLTRWQRFLAHVVLRPAALIGGARIPELPRIPGGAGTLILMNHQSLLDIPLLVASLHGTYPRIVTRKRYLRWIPLISHMVRLYQYPLVDSAASPSALKEMRATLAAVARESDVPLAIFPEGTRSRDGTIGRFRSKGLEVILKQRPWTVYVLVADGFWQRATFHDFLSGIGEIEGRISLLGPFEWTDPQADAVAFAGMIRSRMIGCHSAMSAKEPA